MNELHKSQEGLQPLVPNEGQRGLLCSNICPSRCPSLRHTGHIFEETTIASLKELGAVFGRIHKRVVSEGYVMSDGKFIKPDKSA
jgi:hypothetical protein